MLKKFKKVFGIIMAVLLVSIMIPVTPTQAIGETVTGLKLIDPTDDSEVDDIIDNGYINLARLSTVNLNVKAVTNPATIGSVKFELDSVVEQIDSTGPCYSLFGDSTCNFNGTRTLSLGAHTIKATPYSGSGATGTAGASLTVNITVVNDSTSPTVSGVTNGSFYNTSKTITFTDNVDTNPTATLDGNSFTSGATVTTEGQHVLRVQDHYGNAITPIYFTIDKTKPVIVLRGNNPYDSEIRTPFMTELSEYRADGL